MRPRDPSRRRATPRLRRNRRPGPFGPVVEKLGQPAAEWSGPRLLGEVRDQRLESGLSLGGQAQDIRCPRPDRHPRSVDGHPDSHPNRSSETQPGRAVDRQRNNWHTRSKGQVGSTVTQRQDDLLTGVDPPFTGDSHHGSLAQQRSGARRRGGKPTLGRPIRDDDAGPAHNSVSDAAPHLLLLGPEEVDARAAGDCGEDVERIGPILMRKAQDRRAVREALHAFHADPREEPDGQVDESSHDPVPPHGPARGLEFHPVGFRGLNGRPAERSRPRRRLIRARGRHAPSMPIRQNPRCRLRVFPLLESGRRSAATSPRGGSGRGAPPIDPSSTPSTIIFGARERLFPFGERFREPAPRRHPAIGRRAACRREGWRPG